MALSAQHRARISYGVKRAHARKRELMRVRPRDIERLRRDGAVSESLRPLLAIAEDEAAELIASLGGADAVTEQQRILIEDVVAVGMVLRAELAHYLQTRDTDSATRITSTANARRASLVALGLERQAKPIPRLQEYLDQKAASAAPDGEKNATPYPDASAPEIVAQKALRASPASAGADSEAVADGEGAS